MARHDNAVKAAQSDSLHRGEERTDVVLPVRLTTRLIAASGESIPAMLVNISASGVLITADVRFSALLPPKPGTIFRIAFFFEEIEVREERVRVERLTHQGSHAIEIGCAFCDLPDATRTMLRHKIAALAAK